MKKPIKLCGYAGGATALGHKTKNKDLIMGEDRAEVIRMIFKMKRYKKVGLREIARELNKNSVPAARGGKWHGRTIKYLLENPLYKGVIRYKDNNIKNKDLALV